MKKSLDYIAQSVVDCRNEIDDAMSSEELAVDIVPFTRGMFKAYLDTLGFDSWDAFRDFYIKSGRLQLHSDGKKNASVSHWVWKDK